MNEAVAACLRGEISPHVALSRMLLGAADAPAIRSAIDQARCPDPRWATLAKLAEDHMAEFDLLSSHIRRAGSDHSRVGDVAGIAAFFDAACAVSPEAGVALYSLGDPLILAEATAELVAWLQAEALLLPGAAVLDVGCGIGRVCAAVAPHCRTVLGIDIAPCMVAEARRRSPQLAFALTDGSSLPPGPWDLVLMVDAMPYVLQSGLAEGTVAAAMASLAPGGALAVLNLSYGREPAVDLADARRWADRHGATLAHSRPFKLWDGAAYVLRTKRAGAGEALSRREGVG